MRGMPRVWPYRERLLAYAVPERRLPFTRHKRQPSVNPLVIMSTCRSSDRFSNRSSDEDRPGSPLHHATIRLPGSLTSQFINLDNCFHTISQALEGFGHVFHVESPRILMCKRVVEATPREENFWRASDPKLPRNLGSERLWFGWDALVIYDQPNSVQFQGCFSIDGRVLVKGNPALMPFISKRNIALVRRDLKLTANALRNLLRNLT